MTDLLGIGASGVRAYQTALSTTSDNIANAGASGYVRRTTTLNEVTASGSAAGNGNGVIASGVVRSTDAFQAGTLRAAGSDLARTSGSIMWLERLDTALSGQGLSDRLTDFFNSASQVAADPSASAPRTVMLENAQSVAQAFTATGQAIDAIQTEIDVQGQGAADQLTSDAAALAKINAGLARTQTGTSAQAALLDQRDQLLGSMSATTDIQVSFDSLGRATVRGGSSSGPLLVQGDQAASVSYARNDEGAVAFTVNMGGTRSVLSPTGGAMAGVAEGAQRVADARGQVDALASSFVSGVNQVQADGRDLSGNAGAAIFASDAGDPSRVSVAMTDWRGIAAASVGGGPRDNSNLTALSDLRTSAGYEGQATALVSANGAALAARNTVADAQTTIRDQAQAALDNVSGVDLDHEAVDLMRFQQAYQASSRVIQVARETLQTLFDIR